MPCKTVGVFQVPHHGSKKNSSMAQTKGQGSYLSCHTFYTTFVAKIYLISHGNHKGYNHPHSEVITGILSAAVQNKNKCKIVVTATQFESSSSEENAKINYIEGGNNVSNWRNYVDIYYFKKDIPYVTLDHTDKTVPDDLQKYSIEEENDEREKREHSIEKGSSSAILEETLITEEGSSSAIPNKSEETPITEHSKSRSSLKVMYQRKTLLCYSLQLQLQPSLSHTNLTVQCVENKLNPLA
ncbi:uncharacterized protein LOC135334512 [Halichondria panicea]|uniref:uncharacterized protein LOC135334512 n=1 Tax=Halichondria panicea TaxID=6063 RepID=UPI00312B8F1C